MNPKSVRDELPKDKQYVLVHLTIGNWIDEDDPNGDRYWRVVKFCKGISKKERLELPAESERKELYMSADEGGNNAAPYYWKEFGPGSYFGQDVDFWCELPTWW